MQPPALARRVTVVPLPDPAVEAHGFAAGGESVWRCYLPLIGPSSWLVYSRLAPLAVSADRSVVDVVELAREIGLHPRPGRRDPLAQSLSRLEAFGLAEWRHNGAEYAVRRCLPALGDRQAARLPQSARLFHFRAVHGGDAR
jgi:hypothetical protein